jgi:hypothetical protein
MMLLGCGLGVLASVIGIYVGYHADYATGGVIVLASTAMFFGAWLFAPGTGLVPEAMARRGAAPEAEAEVIVASPEIISPHTS